jgi:histidinol-phosphate aminotransferase
MPHTTHGSRDPIGVRLRPDLDTLPGYVPGRAPSGRPGRTFKLSSNELPWPPLPAVVRAGRDAVALAHRYPDAVGGSLVRRLAADLALPEDRLVVGGGSIALLQLLVQTVAAPGDRVVYAWRSYEAYPIVVQVSGARSVTVPLRGQTHDLPALAAATHRADARMVIVCNPNNPTGTAVSAALLADFVAAVPADCLVVLDEAYAEFNDDPERPDGFDLARRHPNVAVLRTFSKAHGLAGMRVGYCVAPPDLAGAMRRVALPFGVSGVAERMAIAALDSWAAQAPRVESVVERRAGLTAALQALGFVVPDSRANFVWLPLRDRSSAFEGALAEAGISVRTFAGEGVRITIGEPEALSAVVEVAATFSDQLAST